MDIKLCLFPLSLEITCFKYNKHLHKFNHKHIVIVGYVRAHKMETDYIRGFQLQQRSTLSKWQTESIARKIHLISRPRMIVFIKTL